MHTLDKIANFMDSTGYINLSENPLSSYQAKLPNCPEKNAILTYLGKICKLADQIRKYDTKSFNADDSGVFLQKVAMLNKIAAECTSQYERTLSLLGKNYGKEKLTKDFKKKFMHPLNELYDVLESFESHHGSIQT